MNRGIQVYKASAGSGKTFRLAIEYLKLLLFSSGQNKHRAILAVSFTNKATAEMKSRILGELYGMASGCSSSQSYLDLLVAESGVSPGEIRQKARAALTELVYDYSWFRIETIDSFYQSVLRNMAKELGLGAYFNIELDQRKAVHEAVRLLLDELTADSADLEWIYRILQDKFEEEKQGTTLTEEMIAVGLKTFDEAFKRKQSEVLAFFAPERFSEVNAFIAQQLAERKRLRAGLEKHYQDYLALLAAAGKSPADLSRSSKGRMYAAQIGERKYLFEDKINSQELAQWLQVNSITWFTKKEEVSQPELSQKLTHWLKACEAFRQEAAPRLANIDLLLTDIRLMGLLASISRKIYQQNSSQNRFLLADTAALLHRMIGENDTPFIFEKIGAQLRHILIDEFQDTSEMQWKNFKLLFEEILSKNGYGLIVGDVKQSIYRFRNSQWKTLNSIEKEFSPAHLQVASLQTNWRTDERIVDFNNQLFQRLAQFLSESYSRQMGVSRPEFEGAYSDVAQQSIAKKKGKGFVSFQNVDKDGRKSGQGAVLIAALLRLRDSGVRAEDIMILVRSRKHIAQVAGIFGEHLLHDGANYDAHQRRYFTLISPEAYTFSSSKALQIVVCALRVMEQSQNALFRSELLFHWARFQDGNCNESLFFSSEQKNALPKDFEPLLASRQAYALYDCVEKIIQLFDLGQQTSEEAFLYAFLDEVLRFSDESGRLETFLQYWDDILKDKPIEIGQELQGVRILTIHKSKGLEFHSVVLPFCDWKIVQGKNFFWHERGADSRSDYDQLPLISIPYEADKLEVSVFRKSYEEESLQLWMDQLNLLYVAFTRPRHNLMVLVDGKSQLAFQDVGDWLRQGIPEDDLEVGSITPSEPALPPQEEGEESIANIFQMVAQPTAVPFSSGTLSARIYLSGEAKNPFQSTANDSNTALSRGILYHRLLAYVRHASDQEKALRKMVAEGYFSQEDMPLYRHWLQEKLSGDERIIDWFSGKYRLFNESRIVFRHDKGCESRRPDRVMLDAQEKTIRIVDFKTGEPHPSYRQQILLYAELLQEMYPDHVLEAYLWYLDQDHDALEKIEIPLSSDQA